MKLVYTHPSHILVAQARSALELVGIESVVRNEYASGAIGELAPIDAWPELWVIRDRDDDSARRVIQQSLAEIEGTDWQCGQCEHVNPANFEFCWHCADERRARAQP